MKNRTCQLPTPTSINQLGTIEGKLSGRTFGVDFDETQRQVILLDQHSLPEAERYFRLSEADDVVLAIRNMVVRGAPAIGIAAAYGLALAARRQEGSRQEFALAMGLAGKVMARARPTAVNLMWAVARMTARAAQVADQAPESRFKSLLTEARSIHQEDKNACDAMAKNASSLIPNHATVLTHCNTGALATGGIGTALGAIRYAHGEGKVRRVLANETRPYLQGARLTSWELERDGIETAVITDAMAGHFMPRQDSAHQLEASETIDCVIVGSDRISRNGDIANKIGTYSMAVLANYHNVPFVVVAPMSTIDRDVQLGSAIPIEERSEEEVSCVAGVRMVKEGIRCLHPAFDVTPANLIDAIVTERGIISPKSGDTVDDLFTHAAN